MSTEFTDNASNDLWKRARTIYLSSLRSDDDRSQAESYFSMISSVTKNENIFTIYVNNEFAAQFFNENYLTKLKSSFDLAGGDVNMVLEIKFDPSSKPEFKFTEIETQTNYQSNSNNSNKVNSQFILSTALEENYTFDEFVQGPSNSWAFAAAKGVANNPGQKSHNPLFIHGGTGLGKTHLMQAIGNELRKSKPSLYICYITAETFLNEYVNALQHQNHVTIEQFRNKYRSIDILLIDDIQFLQRGVQCQEEFFNTFNALITNHKQIVMTSDVSPKNLPALEERLISRFYGGMVQEIEAPGYETRLAILKKKSETIPHSISYSTLEFLAEHIKSHVRAMEGALAKIHMTLTLNPTMELSKDALSRILKDFIEKEQKLKKITISEIQECICKKYGVTMSQILSSDRTASLVTPRQLAMYISRKYTTNSLQEIAAAFDKKHATIIHGVRTIDKRLDVEEDLKNSLEDILSEFGYNISDKMVE